MARLATLYGVNVSFPALVRGLDTRQSIMAKINNGIGQTARDTIADTYHPFCPSEICGYVIGYTRRG